MAGALPEVERSAIANHAASCGRCLEVLDLLVASNASHSHPPGREVSIDGDGTGTGELELLPGARVGRYVIGSKLGAGGMGVVYAAFDAELRRRVAVKLVRTDRRSDAGPAGRERLMREARTLAGLPHPNVVTVFDVGTHEGHLFIAMELVDGGSLRAWLRRSPRPAEEIIDHLVDAGRGLAAAHTAGVVHRDVKPDNILIGLDHRARLTDFGLAHIGDAEPAPRQAASDANALLDEPHTLTRTGTVMGTPAYMAPEQLTRGETDQRTDQWSFCATLYEALAGVQPFVDDLTARLAAIAEGRLAAPRAGRRVPAWVLKLVTRGLLSDPAARWPSMDALVHALARGRHRRRRVAIGVSAVIAIITVAAGVWFARGESPAIVTDERSATSFVHWDDSRVGCNCPLSACTDHCVSVCRAREYRLGKPIPGISVPGRQEALHGASLDGDTILFLAGHECHLDRLMLARRHGETFASVDLTDKLDLQRVALFEGCCTLSADGETLIMTTADRRSFARYRVVGDDVVPADPAEFRDLVAQAGIVVLFPVISADGLTLYYSVNDLRTPSEGGRGTSPWYGAEGLLSGSYTSTRPDQQSPFPAGSPLSGAARRFENVTGVSSDGLSLFVKRDWETHVLVRTNTTEPFSDPAPGLHAARMPGWRTIPLADCTRLLTTYTPGGCDREDIAYLEAVPR